MKEKRVNIGVIGAGRIGRLHAEHLAFRIPGANLSAIADVNRAAAEACAGQCNIPALYEDYHGLLNDSAIEAVAICSSSDTHSQIIEEAAAAGKHIFCEKPIELDLGKIDKALAAVEKAGVKLQIGFNRRFDPNFRHVHETVSAGKIGKPHILRITSRDPAPPPIEYTKVSGGLFLDMTIHDFDMARYLIGSEVTSVYATGGVMVDPRIGEVGDIDTAVTVLRFANGVIATIDNCRRAVYGYDQRVEVFGAEGSISVENERPHRATLSNRDGVHTALPLHFIMERYTASFIAEMSAFVDCLLQDTKPPVTGIDGRMAVVLGLAAMRSYEQDRPVALSDFDEA